MLSHTMSKPEFAEALNEARQKLGVTQRELSEMTGIGQKSISRYGRARAPVSAKTVAALNAVLFPSEVAQKDANAHVEPGKVALVDASIEGILEELKRRGFKQVTLSAG